MDCLAVAGVGRLVANGRQRRPHQPGQTRRRGHFQPHPAAHRLKVSDIVEQAHPVAVVGGGVGRRHMQRATCRRAGKQHQILVPARAHTHRRRLLDGAVAVVVRRVPQAEEPGRVGGAGEGGVGALGHEAGGGRGLADLEASAGR